MWKKIARFALQFRIPILIFILLVTAFMGYIARNLRLQYEYALLLPPTDSLYIRYVEFQKLFGNDANLLVVGIQDANFFTKEKFNLLNDLSDSLKKINGIKSLLSVAQAYNIQKNTEQKKFDFVQIFPKKIDSQTLLDSLKNVFLSLPFYKGLLYNEKTNVYLFAVTISPEIFNTVEREEVVRHLKKVIKIYTDKFNLQAHYSGLPYVRTEVAQKVKKELNLFIFLALVVCAIFLYILFRSLRVIFFAVIVIGICVIWAMGSMVLFGYNITILTGLIPSLLVVIGIPNVVYLLTKYHIEYRKLKDKTASLTNVISRIGVATFLTNLTTAAGFSTFLFATGEILKEFGLIASINIMVVFVLCLFLIPIVFSFLPVPTEKKMAHLDKKWLHNFLQKVTNIVIFHRKKVFIAAISVILIAIFGTTFIKSTGFIVDDIPQDDPVFVDLKFFEKHFGGVMPIEIVIDSQKKNGIMRTVTLEKLDSLQNALTRFSVLSRAMSIVDALKFAKQSYYNGDSSSYSLPDNQERNFILSYLSGQSDKKNLLNTILDSTRRITRMSVKVADIGTVRIKHLTSDIRNVVDSIFPASKYNVSLSGTSILHAEGVGYLIANLFSTILLAILIISLIMASMFLSWRMTLISLVPNFIPLIITAGIMGYFEIFIKPSTIIIFSISFGIAVDGAIHLLTKYRFELRNNSYNIGEAVRIAIRETGISMLYSAIILFFGFAIFIASGFGGTKALGILMSMTLLFAITCNIVILPSLLLVLHRNFLKKVIEEPYFENYNEELDIDLERLEAKGLQPRTSNIEKE